MIRLEVTGNFRREHKKFIAKDQIKAQLVSSALRTFAKNPKYSSLHTEKLQGSKIWTIRISKGNRVFFYWINSSTALLVDIGPHDKYRRY